MARTKKPKTSRTAEPTPTEADRRVLKRAGQPVSRDVPDVADVGGTKKIKPVDLSLHGDGVDHWQDEMPLNQKHSSRRNREK